MTDLDARPTVSPLKGEDRPFFARAYREHYAALHAFVRRRVGTDAEAADIAQEAYLRVLRYHDQQEAGAVKALLFRIAVNLLGIRGRIARTHRWSDHVPLDDELALMAGDPALERHADGQQAMRRLLAVVQSLPHRCQQVFVLSRFQGLSRGEVAGLLKMSTKAVDKHLAKALGICRQKMGEEDV